MAAKARWRRRALGVFAVLLLAPVVPGIMLAQAHSFTASSSVSIHWNADTHKFTGHVSSPRDACVGGRTVDLFRVQAGTDKMIGSDTTGAGGNWSIRLSNALGSFYAKVLRRSTGGYGHSHVCLGDRSETIRVS